MISGRFGDTTGRAYVSGRLLLPRLGVASNLSLLVDTGSDRTTLMPADAIKMGIDASALGDPITVGGLGGAGTCYLEEAVLGFAEPDRALMRYYAITIMIPEASPDLMPMPPLLGRDVLDRWRMIYDPGRAKLTFTVRSADHTAKA